MSAAVATGLGKFAIKFFARRPEAVDLESIVPVFHRWIQAHAVPGILVDVADYGHLPNGPGVVLIGHEADFFMDRMEGPLGLLYNRKHREEGSFADRLRSALRVALEACLRLEEDVDGAVRFDGGKALFLANDRLLAPNTDETFAALRPDLESAFGSLYGGRVELRRDPRDPRRRLTVDVQGPAPSDVSALRARLG